MKQFSILILLSFCVSTINAQTINSESKKAIGITYSGLGSNDAFYFEMLDGAGSYLGKGYHSFGVAYTQSLIKFLDLETGISFSNYKYRFSNSSLGPDAPEPYFVSNTMVDIPITARLNFLKYLFINSGVVLGIDATSNKHLDSQTGLGLVFGLGAKYDFKNIPFGLFINTYYKIHNIVPFAQTNYNLRTDESGLRFGVIYNF